MGENMLLQINEFNEFQLGAYENAKNYENEEIA